MEDMNEEQRRKHVRNFIERNGGLKKIDIVNHFKKEGMAERTIYKIIKRIEDGQDDKKRPGGGRPAKPLTPKIADDLLDRFEGRAGASIKRAADKHKTSRWKVRQWLKELEIKKMPRKTIPKTTEKQAKKKRNILNKISRKEFLESNDTIDIVMDDETYLDFNGYNCGRNKYYYASGYHEVENTQKYIQKSKFPNKLMVWLAISKKGCSKPYFRRQREGAINGQIYRDECIKKRLIPFIRNTYPDDNYMFWPDLASSHYSKPVMELFKSEKLKVLAKERNPPNLPQIRKIETFWAHFKFRIFDNGFVPETIDDLEKRAKNILKTFDKTYFEGLMEDVGKRVRKAANRGVLSVIN